MGGEDGIAVVPFLTNPTSCSGKHAGSRNQSGLLGRAKRPKSPWKKMPFGPLTGCEHLTMAPSMTVEPTTSIAGSATGLDFDLEVPQTFENPSRSRVIAYFEERRS